MNLRVNTIFLCLGLLAIPLANYRLAYATLGERADSVAKDRKALSAVQRSTTTGANYTVQEVASDTTTVREYLNADGVVFAVAWNGRAHPDLETLLGSYAGEFKKALNKHKRKHGERQLKLTSDQMVVETGGHMGNLRGRAYLPAMIPSGVSKYEIK
jgi:hypothetical protein